MRPPYDLQRLADAAGTGDHTPPPYEAPVCVRCGGPLPQSGRIYCGDPNCVRRWVTIGNRAERRGERDPLIADYSY